MANLIKIILFLTIIIGIGIYFFTQGTNLSEIFPSISKTRKTSPPSPVFPSRSAPTISPTIFQTTFLESSIPAGFTREQISPYFQKITISSAYSSSYGGYPSQIRLYFSLSKDENINITGWRIKSNRREIVIERGINIYSPFEFPAGEDIIISGNGSINIYNGKSPINRNLRINKCLGYLENFYDFNPSLPQNCPSIPRSEIVHLSGQCQSYILSLWGCKLPSVSFYNALPGTDEGNACRAFLNTISHGSCFLRHRYDIDFLSNEWRIWTDQNILDPQHDRLLLFDKQGLLADEYVY